MRADFDMSMARPSEYAEFVEEKQLQLLLNVLSSSAAGVAIANAVALVSGDAPTTSFATKFAVGAAAGARGSHKPV